MFTSQAFSQTLDGEAWDAFSTSASLTSREIMAARRFMPSPLRAIEVQSPFIAGSVSGSSPETTRTRASLLTAGTPRMESREFSC
jgi:hypothetical protein